MKRKKAGKARPKARIAVKPVQPERTSPKARASISLDLQHELAATRERLTATSDILHVVAASPGKAEGALRKIAEITARLFNAAGVSFRIADGDDFKVSVGVGQGAEHALGHPAGAAGLVRHQHPAGDAGRTQDVVGRQRLAQTQAAEVRRHFDRRGAQGNVDAPPAAGRLSYCGFTGRASGRTPRC